jgi:DNA-binding transcriptional LysR family regulator
VRCSLFVRSPKGLTLNDQGRAFLPHAEATLDRLQEGFAAVDDPNMKQVLRLVVLSSFSAKWRAPRLPRFSDAHPNIDIALFHDHELPDFENSGTNLTIL